MRDCCRLGRRVFAAIAICTGCSGAAAVAQNVAYHYHVESTAPRCGQRGTTVEVTMTGFCLERPQEVIFYRPGIRAVELSSETKDTLDRTSVV